MWERETHVFIVADVFDFESESDEWFSCERFLRRNISAHNANSATFTKDEIYFHLDVVC